MLLASSKTGGHSKSQNHTYVCRPWSWAGNLTAVHVTWRLIKAFHLIFCLLLAIYTADLIFPVIRDGVRACLKSVKSNVLLMSWFCVLGRVHWKPAPKPQRGPSCSPNLSGLIRRSMSCPRSISSLTAQSPSNETRRPKTATHMANGATAASQTAPAVTPMTPARPHTPSRSQSLSRNTSANRVPHSSSLGAIHSNTASFCITWHVGMLTLCSLCAQLILTGLLFAHKKTAMLETFMHTF